MATLSQYLRPLDEAHTPAALPAAAARLREAIENRILGPDDALPPERDLAEELAVSRITVRKAIDGLVEEGLLVRRQGSGTFVSTRVEKNFSKLTSFSEDMRARGRKPRSVWLNRAAGTVTPEESLTLRSSPGTPVYRFHRIRYADEAPMALEYATVLASCLPSIEAVEASLYEALERTGNRPVRALQRLRAVLFTAEQAKLLKAHENGCGSAGRAPRLPQGRPRGGVLAVLLSRRHLRLRRRAQRRLMSLSSRMYREAAQAPHVVREQLETNAERVARIGALLREMKPRAVVTCARGSSDHAATFAKYLIETRAGVLTSSAAPSVSSLYEAQPDLRGVVFLAISQSGKSPDLLASVEAAKRGGALVIALVQLDRLAARRARGSSRAAARRRRDERRGDQVLHRVAERGRASRRELDRRSARCSTRCCGLPDQLEQAWALDWSGAVPACSTRRTCTSSAAASASASRRKPRSSSRRPAGCTPRRSAPPR